MPEVPRVPCWHHTVAGAARTPVESTVVVYDGSNWRHKLIRPIGGSSSGQASTGEGLAGSQAGAHRV